MEDAIYDYFTEEMSRDDKVTLLTELYYTLEDADKDEFLRRIESA